MKKEARKAQLSTKFGKLHQQNCLLKNAVKELEKQQEECRRLVQEQDEELRASQRRRYLSD